MTNRFNLLIFILFASNFVYIFNQDSDISNEKKVDSIEENKPALSDVEKQLEIDQTKSVESKKTNNEEKDLVEEIESSQINKSENNETKEEEKEFELLDKIESEVTYLGSENIESNVITKQEIERRGFDGNVYTVTDLEDQNLADQFSKVLKANITNDDINRNLKKNGMTEKDIRDIAERWGYLSKDEFFEDLKKIYRSNAAMNYEVESQLVASQGEIKEYYTQHIEEYKQEAKYIVETAFIQYPKNTGLENEAEAEEDQNNKENKEIAKMRSELEKYVKAEISKPVYINWDSPVEINHSEITQDNEFLIDLQIGAIHMKEAEGGFILYRMKNKRPEQVLPVENVQESIIVKLKKDKYPFVIDEIKKKLRCQAIIVHPK